jgi:hypothetical protein
MAYTYKKLEAPPIEYETNPSIIKIESSLVVKKVKRTIKGDKSLIITDARTGVQQTGYYGATFYEEKIVDPEKFIKLYTGGVDELLDLSAAGLKVFRVIYLILMEKPNTDIFTLEYSGLSTLKKWKWSQATFISGINELLSKQILFKSIFTAQYFLNVKFFFNGDRVNIVKSYKLKQTDMLDESELLD